MHSKQSETIQLERAKSITGKVDNKLKERHRHPGQGTISLIWEAIGSLGEGVYHDQKVINKGEYHYNIEKQ